MPSREKNEVNLNRSSPTYLPKLGIRKVKMRKPPMLAPFPNNVENGLKLKQSYSKGTIP